VALGVEGKKLPGSDQETQVLIHTLNWMKNTPEDLEPLIEDLIEYLIQPIEIVKIPIKHQLLGLGLIREGFRLPGSDYETELLKKSGNYIFNYPENVRPMRKEIFKYIKETTEEKEK